MKREKQPQKTKKVTYFKKLERALVIFILLVFVLCFVQWNVPYEEQERELEPVDQSSLELVSFDQEPECLVIWQDDDMGKAGLELMKDILEQMKVPYETMNGKDVKKSDFQNYRKVVLSLTSWHIMGEEMLDLIDWTKGGGNLMVLYTPEVNGIFQMCAEKFGIENYGNYVVVSGLRTVNNFMLGGDGIDYVIPNPYESSVYVDLSDESEVYMVSADENSVPLIWKTPLGEGETVFCNMNFIEKAYRGLYSSAYSLLDEVFAWPVINGSTFYIDDFPSPVPEGKNDYIRRDYGMSVSEFYNKVWWTDIYNLANKYGIRYTGLVIEFYSDDVQQPYEKNDDLRHYQYYGNMLLDQGGEIGYHGYNHMPLCLLGFEYSVGYESYHLWHSYNDMLAGMLELKRFCTELFPKEKFQVYVPPSNILSNEGRTMLRDDVEGIKAIASLYLVAEGENAYGQEFEVSDDGMIETPRVISGYVFGDYMKLAAFTELNFHFVNSHFQHPDDALDEERGAELGWGEMYKRLYDYTDWLYTSAPDIRSLTGSELAAAVQIYDNLEVEREYTDGVLKLNLGNFRNEAWLMVRVNEGKPREVKGGNLKKIQGDLYLLEAQSDKVEIQIA